MPLIELIYMASGLVRQQFKHHRQPRNDIDSIRRIMLRRNPGGRWQPEGEQMVKSILTWLQGISLRQGLNGIPTQGKGETREPAQNSCGFFSTREAIGLFRHLKVLDLLFFLSL